MKPFVFKSCTNCPVEWQTLDDFLADPELVLAGYQVAFEDLEGGLFYFNHMHSNCGTTLAIPVKEFTGLSNLPFLVPRGVQPGGKCSGSCVRKGDLTPCPLACECVWVREVMHVILNWEKRAA